MKRLFLLLAAVVSSSLAFTQAFLPGNLVISRYGDGIASFPVLQKTVPVFLDEYDTAGHLVRTLALPSTSSDDDTSNNRILAGGTKFKDEGLITLSPNGQFLTMIGYNTEPYTTTYSNTTQRTIGVITSDGIIDTRTGVRAAIGNPRCAITPNGASIWFVGSGTGLRQKVIGTAAKNDSVILNPPGGYNSVYIFNGQLYYTTDYAAGPRIAKLGQGMPYAEQTAGTPLPGYPNTGSPDQIIMLDYNTATPDPDLMYVTDSDLGSLQKWVFDGMQWVARGSVLIPGITNDIRGVTGDISSGHVVLYALTSNRVLKFTDSSAISSDFSNDSNAPVVLVQAAAKTLFKGIAFTPGTIKEKPFEDISSRKFASLIQQKTNLIRELKTNVTFQRYPGVEETNITYTSNKGVPIALFFLKVNLSNPNVTIEAGTPYDRPEFARQTIRAMIPYKNAANSKRQVIAASNGDYYSWTGEPDGVVHKNGVVIKASPPNKFFFSIKNDGKALVGDKRIYDAAASRLKEAIGGRFYLMHYGEVMTEHLKDISVEPRTTVGILSPDRVVFMWVDGRRTGHSAGLSLTDMAYIYKAIGATDAINMDGGGSTTFIMRKKDGTYETRNKPSDNSERANANALMVMMKTEILKPLTHNFTGMPEENSVKLSWTTDSEGDYKTYTVERSKDGKLFEETGIEMKQDTGANASILFESFDNDPYFGQSYYRLKKTGFDGKKAYSNTVVVMLEKQTGELMVYPNPVHNKVTLTIDVDPGNQILNFSLVDASGNTLMNYKGNLAAINELLNKNMNSLKAGVYLLRIAGEKNAYTSRFIKE